jgi:Holliday junction resolvase-like predicted endonuclease
MEKIEPIICEEARLHRSSYGPDFIAVKNDDLVFVEVKMGKGHLTKYQREFFSKAKNIGIRILIILINESIKLNEF